MPSEVVYEIDGQRVVFPLERDEITIGRDEHNDLVIARQSISRRHAKLYRQGDAWRIKDLGSTGGTKVNQLSNADTVLRDGDTIFLYRFPLTFVDRAGGGASLAPQPATSSPELGLQTMVQSAVDFSALAASPPNAEHLQKLLAIVTRASKMLLVSQSIDVMFEKTLDLIFEYLPVQRGCIMLWDSEQQDFVTSCVKHDSSQEHAEIRFSRTIAEKVYKEKVAVITTDALSDERFASGASIIDLGIRSAMAAPLWKGETVNGLIYVDTLLHKRAFDTSDLDLLSALGNHIAVAMEEVRLQKSFVEQQLVRKRLERYHSPAVVERITRAGDSSGDALVADERDVTVLFADVVGFSKRCESMEPRAVADMLNRYFSEMAEMVFEHDGTLDKFIGDCLMAVFGAPFSSQDHPVRAVKAALGMRRALQRLNAPLEEGQRLQFRVGLHSGRVVAGDIGSLRRSDYTVLGTTVNLAARLESEVAGPGQIVISDATYEVIRDRYRTRDLGEHQVQGISAPVHCYELIGSGEA